MKSWQSMFGHKIQGVNYISQVPTKFIKGKENLFSFFLWNVWVGI